ncbi:hypothetical protein [Natronobiforma cellulositropha]|uniref:hypothetical protein n=1 Tax=Natronobiforma cellulositropha TaxID=1679076 RepID=UPI0021D57819|nr:hypothetical protein [Natronobiforma cellulositropha]
MHALRSCDFCGTDAVGTFEVVPPELEPTEREQRRVVLCRACQERLDVLLEPLLARLDAPASDDGRRAATTTPDDERAEHRTAETAPDDGTERSRPTRRSITRAGASAGRDEDVKVEDDEPGGQKGDGRTASEPPRAAASAGRGGATEGITLGRGDTRATAERSTTDDETAAAAKTEESTSDERPPKAYGSVLRLLQNREFPIERSAAESLAAGAYDLERHEVEAVIDHALEQGELREDGSNLHRP